ncbi:GntR family transcriptional regulator [Streptomyces bobili]|uniref:GntR family transcriptional regulator n=1 Tax=Streptomyces bobili TaxID=67280 RepID=UPI00365ED5EF
MSVNSTEPRSLSDAAYQRLRSDIVSCQLAPGERLTERGLAESTGIGIAPIRDALTRLDHEGLVRTLPRKGYQVAPLTLKSIDDLFTLWRIVGPEIARLGLRDVTSEEHGRLIDTFQKMAELSKGRPPGQDDTPVRLVELADIAFGTLAAATRNDYLISIYRRLQNDMARVWALTAQSDAPVPDMGVDQRWVEMVERRDGEAAAETVRTSIGEVHNNALRIFSRWPSVAASEITPLRA